MCKTISSSLNTHRGQTEHAQDIKICHDNTSGTVCEPNSYSMQSVTSDVQ